ncbi:hypothetical protein DPMN_184517 [Dreissena polymorpha]|uniref:Uncharacterized protein n=1 Tax=Dreissena polymorpha TaxID=45954 RepID=A0A9D4DJR7_DREPO|nr:hypothetical protein DPMN_184517 [Dreissena polymorpha]
MGAALRRTCSNARMVCSVYRTPSDVMDSWTAWMVLMRILPYVITLFTTAQTSRSSSVETSLSVSPWRGSVTGSRTVQIKLMRTKKCVKV